MILIVTSFTTNFVNVIGGDNPAKGYMVLVAIGAILMCITSWIAFAKCKERHTVAARTPARIALEIAVPHL